MQKKNKARIFLVPLMLILSSAIMAMAWLGHLKFKEDLSFMAAALSAWLLVLPEYLLNVSAIRWGVGVYQPSEMAAMNLSSGIVFIALVSNFFLGEEITTQKYIGFGLMIVAMILISESKPSKTIKKEKQ
ncbi:MAG: DMT family protein [Crocinitomicaceae bacterium]